MEKENKNWMSQAGILNVDDMEVVRSLGLPEDLAYTDKLNGAAVRKARELTYKGYIDKGMTEKEAKRLSDESHAETVNQIKNAEQLSGKKLLK